VASLRIEVPTYLDNELTQKAATQRVTNTWFSRRSATPAIALMTPTLLQISGRHDGGTKPNKRAYVRESGLRESGR
jgi:hypothetical protein